MQPIAFLSAFTATPLRPQPAPFASRRCQLPAAHPRPLRRAARAAAAPEPSQPAPSPPASAPQQSLRSRGRIAIIAKATKQETVETVESTQGGTFGFKAKAYWDGMGVIPLFFTGFGLTALAIKMLKLKGGELRGGEAAVRKLTVPKTAITSEEEEAELHVFKCGGCGYEIYPARGREFKFFPDSFKCPLCGTPKSEFWDLNDPTDPRNQEPDDDSDDDGDEQDGATEVGQSTDASSNPEASATDGSLPSSDSESSPPKGTNPSPPS